jgi:RNA polymerase sigma-70 factor (ECF subfamily)
MHESDENRWSALMVSAQSGNQPHYRQLLGELAIAIHKFLCVRFGDHPSTEDMVQESLMAIHKARHTYDPKRPFRAWMFAIVRHKAIDVLRGEQARVNTLDTYGREQAVLSQADGQNVFKGEIADGRLFASLSPTYKEVLILTKIQGYSVAETADRLGISESAVKVRVHRAIRKLQQSLARDAF